MHYPNRVLADSALHYEAGRKKRQANALVHYIPDFCQVLITFNCILLKKSTYESVCMPPISCLALV